VEELGDRRALRNCDSWVSFSATPQLEVHKCSPWLKSGDLYLPAALHFQCSKLKKDS